MRVNIYPTVRYFDNRQVYIWELIDKQHRVLDQGQGLTKKSALLQARLAAEKQGPELLLNMLEMKKV
jgi:hypothetical protein